MQGLHQLGWHFVKTLLVHELGREMLVLLPQKRFEQFQQKF
jgi:hypothetical protein